MLPKARRKRDAWWAAMQREWHLWRARRLKGWLLLLVLGVALAASAVFDFVEALYHNPRRLANADSKGPR